MISVVLVHCSWLTILTDTRLLHGISEEAEEGRAIVQLSVGSLGFDTGRHGIECVNYPRGMYSYGHCVCRGTSPMYYIKDKGYRKMEKIFE